MYRYLRGAVAATALAIALAVPSVAQEQEKNTGGLTYAVAEKDFISGFAVYSGNSFGSKEFCTKS